jgi:hypothetical protein
MSDGVPCGRTEGMAVPRHPDGGNRGQTGSFSDINPPVARLPPLVVVDVAHPVT